MFKQLYLEANTDLFEYDAEYQEAILEKFVLNWKDRLQAWSIKYDYNILTFFAHRVANRSHTNEALYLLYLLYNRGVKPPRMIEILSMQNEQGWNVCLRLASRVDQKHNINYLLKLLIELTKYNPKDIWRLLSQESQTFVPYAKNMITTLPYLMMMSTDVDNKLLYIHLLKELERFSCTKEEIQQLNMNDNFVSVLQKAEVEVLFQLLFNNYLSKSVCEALVSRKREIFNYIYSIPEDEKNAALASALDDKNHALFFLLHKARYFTSTKETKGEWKRAKAEYEKHGDDKEKEKEEDVSTSGPSISSSGSGILRDWLPSNGLTLRRRQADANVKTEDKIFKL